MRKSLLLLAICLLTTLGLQAQRDITSQYITNATLANGTNGWTVTNFNTPAQGNNTTGWATEAYAGWGSLEKTSYSLTQKITLPKGKYRLANYSFFRQGEAYNTNSTKSLAYLKAGSNQVAIKTLGSITASGYANSQAEGANCFDSKMYRNVLEFSITSDNTQVEIGITGTFDEMRSWMIAGMFELFDLDQTPTEDNPTDVTYAITNSGFEYRDLTGWTPSSSDAFQVQNNTSFDNKAGGYYCEKWQADGGLSNRILRQQLTDMPAGYYTLSAYVYYGGTGAILFAGDSQTQITSNKSGKYSVKKKIAAGESMNYGLKLVSGTSNWVAVDRFTLTYYPVDLTSLKAKHEALMAEAEALSEQNMDFAARATLQNAMAITPSEDEDSYISANEALESAIETAKEAVEQYIYDNVTNENPIDLTSKIKNPGYEEGETGWNKAQNQTGGGSCGVVTEDGTKVFRSTYNTYMRHETIYQEGITLKAGSYRLSARLKGTPKDNHSTFIYATDGAVAHWEDPVFKGNTWYSYLKNVSNGEWTTAALTFTLDKETKLRIGVLSWGNNYTGGEGGAFSVDDWKLELLAYPELQYVKGDATGNGRASVRDMSKLMEALRDNTTNYLYTGADANKDGKIDRSDVEAVETAILNNKEMMTGAPTYDLTVYAEQLLSENNSGANYMVNNLVNIEPGKMTGAEKSLATVKVTISGLMSVSSVSILAKGHESIAGVMNYNALTGNFDITDGQTPSGYAKSMKSDVVNVIGTGSFFTAYLMPTELSQGITVTVCAGNKYYTQDFNSVSLTAGNSVDLSFTNAVAKGAWMATIPGDIHFNLLSLPGAHDAATSTCSSIGKCQSMTIENLLNNGVKSLDLRPYGGSSITADNMSIYHGSLDTGVKFKDALGTVKNYLAANPSESIFILIHDEKGDGATAWKNAVLSCIENVKDYVKVIDNNMTLDDCRGKMVIISRDNVAVSNLLGKCGWGGSFGDKTVYYGMDSNTATPWTLMYQDNYETTDYTNRLADATKLLNDYIKNNETNQNRIYFNTLNIAASGLSALTNHPSTYAKTMNGNFYSSSDITNWDGRLGIVSADFMCDDNYNGTTLCNTIIKQNYKYVYRGRTRNK